MAKTKRYITMSIAFPLEQSEDKGPKLVVYSDLSSNLACVKLIAFYHIWCVRNTYAVRGTRPPFATTYSTLYKFRRDSIFSQLFDIM